jgi:hypothetical protein
VSANILINNNIYVYRTLANPILHQDNSVINVINCLALIFLITKLRRLNFASYVVHKKEKQVTAKRHLAIRTAFSEL